MQEGWIKLNRQITEHWLWLKFPFSYGQAWVDLLLLANHEDEKVPYKGDIVICKRGDVSRSILSLSKRWQWGRDKTRDFLRLLEKDEMIVLNATTNRTTITIVNYDKYQVSPTTNTTTNPQRTQQRTHNEPDTNKNDKNDKNEKNNTKEINKEKYEAEITEILLYFNQKTGSKYGTKNKQINEMISARLNEGFSVADFKKVIDNKYFDWHDKPDMKKFIRPSTLFRPSHFEEYLNEKGGSVNNEPTEWDSSNWSPFEWK